MGAAIRKAASDRVLLGSTGIRASRLAMGSGSHSNDQARLGVDGFARLLTFGYEQGINFFETADAYGAHPHVAEAIRRVGRNNVVILTKTKAETAAGVEADLARFREELGIEARLRPDRSVTHVPGSHPPFKTACRQAIPVWACCEILHWQGGKDAVPSFFPSAQPSSGRGRPKRYVRLRRCATRFATPARVRLGEIVVLRFNGAACSSAGRCRSWVA